MATTAALISLGCAKNQVDAESMLGGLAQKGYQLTNDPAQAEVIIVNTCGFITSAKEESIETILEMAQYKNEGSCRALIVTGCLAQRYAEQLKEGMPEVDAILGIGHIDELDRAITLALSGTRVCANDRAYAFPAAPRVLSTTPRHAYLKVADGCDNRCSYCAIPLIRGGFISRPIDDLLKEARDLAEQGISEIIPIAQDTTRYGLDLYGKSRLIDLMEGLSEIPGVKWIRPLYLYPDLVSMQLIEAMAQMEKVCKYLDLPIQHINDEVLKNMNRRGDGALIRDVVAKTRAAGDFVLRTTLICGFPGETKAQFDELCAFIEAYPFDRLGAFAYSQEEDTKAALMEGQIRQNIKNMRVNKIMALQRRISHALLEKRVGREYEVIVEGMDADGLLIARSMCEAPDVDGVIRVRGDAPIGQYARVRITQAQDYDLTGVLV